MDQVWDAIRRYGPLAARLLLAQLFIVSGCAKIGHFAQTAGYMAASGLPFPIVLLALTIALEVVGGALLAAGWQARWMAAAFFGFTFLTAVIFHPFWNADAAHYGAQLNNFLKNLAVMGGMLYVMAYEAGPVAGGQPAAVGDNARPARIRKRKN